MSQDNVVPERPVAQAVGRRSSIPRIAILLGGVLLVLQACGGAEQDAKELQVSVESGVVAPRAADVPSYTAAAGGPQQPVDTAPIPRVIIRNGEATLEVDSLDGAITRLTRLVERAGGFVVSSHLSGSQDRSRTGRLTARVPADRFDALLAGLRSVGEVEEVNVTSDDVTEEFVDVTARVANARRMEERLLELLRERTGSLEEVLAVERELMRVREEIERAEGRLRYLRSRAAMSTISVALHEPESLFQETGPAGALLADAFRDAWRNFVLFVAGFISVLGILVPLGILILAAVLVYRRLRRFLPKRGVLRAEE